LTKDCIRASSMRKRFFTLASSKKYSMRAIDTKILEELEMLYGDKDCFASIRDWFGTAEAYWTNLERLFMVADYAKKHNPSAVEEITTYRGVHNYFYLFLCPNLFLWKHMSLLGLS
jgi:hypothetical protein